MLVLRQVLLKALIANSIYFLSTGIHYVLQPPLQLGVAI